MAHVIEAIGDGQFYQNVLGYLHEMIGAEHCAVLAFEHEKPIKVGAVSWDGTNLAGQQIDLYLANYWQFDPTIRAAHKICESQPMSLQRLDVDRLPPSGLRDLVYRKAGVSDRLLLYGTGGGCTFSLSILRSDRYCKFSEEEISRLAANAEILLAAVGKHTNLITRQGDLSFALSSLDVIAECMAGAPENLPRREVEVCARILFGMTSFGIGVDLDIGEETVKTYRKRAYQRLDIATQRDLLMWYVRRWGTQSAQPH